MKVQFKIDLLSDLDGKLFEAFMQGGILMEGLPAPFMRFFCGLVIRRTQPEEAKQLMGSVSGAGMVKVVDVLNSVIRMDTDPELRKRLRERGGEDQVVTAVVMLHWLLSKFEDYLPGSSRQPELLLALRPGEGKATESQLLN